MYTRGKTFNKKVTSDNFKAYFKLVTLKHKLI